MKRGFMKLSQIHLTNHSILYFSEMLFQKLLARMLKIICSQGVILEKVCKMTLICMLREKNNASFRQKLNPIAKNIFKRQNPLELVLQDISTFDAQNPIIGSLLRENDVGKKDIDSKFLKKAPNIKDVETKSRFDALRKENDGNDNNNFPPPSPPTNFLPSPTNFLPPAPSPPSPFQPPSPPTYFPPPQLF